MAQKPHAATIFIPARGGSKGIPRKNLAKIGGQSLVSIAIAKGRSLSINPGFSIRVVVSTDDEEIAQEAQDSGADDVHMRPEHLALDASTLEEALQDYVSTSPGQLGMESIFAVTQCTSPFIKRESILRGLELVGSRNFDSAFTGFVNHYWLYRESAKSGEWIPFEHELGNRPPRQQLKPSAHETGGGYFFSSAGFLKHGFRLFGRVGLVEIDYLEAIDIDSPSDLQSCRMISEGVLPDRVSR